MSGFDHDASQPPRHGQSPDAARDDELADSLGIEGIADRQEIGDDGLPVADSPAWRAPRTRNREQPAPLGGERPPGPPPSSTSSESGDGRVGEHDPTRAASAGADSSAGPAAGPADGPASDAVAGAAAGPDDPAGRGFRLRGEPVEDTGRGGRAKKRRKAPWWELPLLVAVAVLVAVLVKSFLVQPFYIPSQSMEKTLHGCPGCSGDRILVNKIIYDFRDPHPGDIVVFNAPQGWNDEPASKPPSNPVARALRGVGQLVGFVPPDGLIIVKRVIATGGESVRGLIVDSSGARCGQDTVQNGCHDIVQVSTHGTGGPWRTLDETYVYGGTGDPAGTFGPLTVPKDRLWVMGDHRNESADSRYHCSTDGVEGTSNDGRGCDLNYATVPVSKVIGKAVIIAWPPSRWRTLGTPSTFTSAAAAVGSGAVPAASSALVVVPLALGRRRRRRGGRTARGRRFLRRR